MSSTYTSSQAPTEDAEFNLPLLTVFAPRYYRPLLPGCQPNLCCPRSVWSRILSRTLEHDEYPRAGYQRPDAISSLVQIHTGIVSVDAASYLKQARELDGKDAQLSQGVSHPDAFLHSQPVDSW
jgi:hypothetical protein